jgi:hypothetical protein
VTMQCQHASAAAVRTAKTSSPLLTPYRSKDAYPHLVEADPTTEGLP